MAYILYDAAFVFLKSFLLSMLSALGLAFSNDRIVFRGAALSVPQGGYLNRSQTHFSKKAIPIWILCHRFCMILQILFKFLCGYLYYSVCIEQFICYNMSFYAQKFTLSD